MNAEIRRHQPVVVPIAPDLGLAAGRVVYAARASDVHTVVIDGVVVVNDGVLTTGDIGKLVVAANKAATRVSKRVD